MPNDRLTGIRVVAVPVTNQDRAIDFYSSALGLEKTMDSLISELETRWVEMSSPGVSIAPVSIAPVSIALIPPFPTFDAGRDTGVRFTTPDAAALHEHLTSAGVSVGDLLLWDGLPPMFEFSDPDDNTLYIVEDTR